MDIIFGGYCLLLVIFSAYLFQRIWKKQWTLENFFLILILLVYVFVPANIIFFGVEIYDTNIDSYLIPASKFVSYSSLFITLMFIVSFLVGGSLRGSSSKYVKIYIRRFNGINFYVLASYFFAILSFVSLIVFVQQFGGFSSFLTNLNLNRAGLLNQQLVGNYAFFGNFINFAILPVIYFLYKQQKSKIDFIFLLVVPCSVLVFQFLLISTAKIKFISLVLLFYFTLSIRRKRLYIISLFLLFTVVFLALPVLDEMFILAMRVFKNEGILAVPFKLVYAMISGSLGQGQYESFLKENSKNLYFKSLEYFTYIQMSLQVSIDNSYPLLFFRDFFTGLNKLTPSSFNIQLGIQVQQLNTALFYNYYPSLPELTWGVPPGIIGLGMYSLSVPGVIIIAFILGYIVRIIDLFFKSIIEVDENFSAFYAYAVSTLSLSSLNGIPKEVIYDYGFLVLLFIFFVVSFRFEFSENKEPINDCIENKNPIR